METRLFFILPRVIANGEKSVGDQTADGDSQKEGDDKGTSNSSEKDKDWKGGTIEGLVPLGATKIADCKYHIFLKESTSLYIFIWWICHCYVRLICW